MWFLVNKYSLVNKWGTTDTRCGMQAKQFVTLVKKYDTLDNKYVPLSNTEAFYYF